MSRSPCAGPSAKTPTGSSPARPGPAPGADIDEFTQTTAPAVEDAGRAVKGKAIIVWTIS